ncbi:hypothetical protein GCM10025788_02400 [Serinicoccus chungangensis]
MVQIAQGAGDPLQRVRVVAQVDDELPERLAGLVTQHVVRQERVSARAEGRVVDVTPGSVERVGFSWEKERDGVFAAEVAHPSRGKVEEIAKPAEN